MRNGGILGLVREGREAGVDVDVNNNYCFCAFQMREPHLVKLDAICRAHGVILVVARSYGLAGYLRVSKK